MQTQKIVLGLLTLFLISPASVGAADGRIPLPQSTASPVVISDNTITGGVAIF